MYIHQSRSDDISLHRISCQSQDIGTWSRTAYLPCQNEPDAAHNAWWDMPDPPPDRLTGSHYHAESVHHCALKAENPKKHLFPRIHLFQ